MPDAVAGFAFPPDIDKPYWATAQRVEDNLYRCGHLVDLAMRVGPAVDEDVLRAVVVLLHATLEDFVRGVCLIRVQDGPVDWMKGYPVDGSLLAADPEARARDVLLKQISRQLEEWSASSAKQIEKQLTKLGVPGEGLEAILSVCEELIARRHQIVHRGDRRGAHDAGGGLSNPETIEVSQVTRWQASVILFRARLSWNLGTAQTTQAPVFGSWGRHSGDYCSTIARAIKAIQHRRSVVKVSCGHTFTVLVPTTD